MLRWILGLITNDTEFVSSSDKTYNFLSVVHIVTTVLRRVKTES